MVNNIIKCEKLFIKKQLFHVYIIRILNQIDNINQIDLTEFPFEDSMENIFISLRFNTGRNPSKIDYDIRQKIENSRKIRRNNQESFISTNSDDSKNNSVFNKTFHENSSEESSFKTSQESSFVTTFESSRDSSVTSKDLIKKATKVRSYSRSQINLYFFII